VRGSSPPRSPSPSCYLVGGNEKSIGRESTLMNTFTNIDRLNFLREAKIVTTLQSQFLFSFLRTEFENKNKKPFSVFFFR
jgi:hypothetical protein